MGSTAAENSGRDPDAHTGESQEKILSNARRILGETSTFLEDWVDMLREKSRATLDKDDREDVSKLIQQVNASWRTVLELQAKTNAALAAGEALDLEAARNEIERRLTRIATQANKGRLS
jgi:hypothetical protein